MSVWMKKNKMSELNMFACFFFQFLHTSLIQLVLFQEDLRQYSGVITHTVLLLQISP